MLPGGVRESFSPRTRPSQPIFSCPICWLLETDLDGLERIHAEKLGEFRSITQWLHHDDYLRLLTEETDAQTNLSVARP
jgi:hypothetical protein